jgi:hypothetical protein
MKNKVTFICLYNNDLIFNMNQSWIHLESLGFAVSSKELSEFIILSLLVEVSSSLAWELVLFCFYFDFDR